MKADFKRPFVYCIPIYSWIRGPPCIGFGDFFDPWNDEDEHHQEEHVFLCSLFPSINLVNLAVKSTPPNVT